MINDKVLSLCRENGIPPDAKELEPVFKMLITPPPAPAGLQRIKDIPVTDPQWVIKDFLERESLSCLYGASDTCKSFLAIALACAIATDTSFYGHDIKHSGAVLYVAMEGNSGLRRRLRCGRLKMANLQEMNDLYTNQMNVQLADPASVALLTSALNGLLEQKGSPLSLLIFDTWSRTLGGDDARTGIAALDDLRLKFAQMTILLVHHCGHDTTRARGWSGLRAAVDTEYRMERAGETPNLAMLKNEKNKEGRKIRDMTFSLESVNLGIDDAEGLPVTSAVLRLCGAPETPCKTKPLDKNNRLALDTLRELEKKQPDGARVIVTDWSAETQKSGMSKNTFWNTKESLLKKG